MKTLNKKSTLLTLHHIMNSLFLAKLTTFHQHGLGPWNFKGVPWDPSKKLAFFRLFGACEVAMKFDQTFCDPLFFFIHSSVVNLSWIHLKKKKQRFPCRHCHRRAGSRWFQTVVTHVTRSRVLVAQDHHQLCGRRRRLANNWPGDCRRWGPGTQFHAIR